MIKLQISGMSCGHCVKAVTDALAAVPGVSRIRSVELDSGLAVVEGDPDPQNLIAAVRLAGYEARELSTP
jgi:copper chaperone CopZ